MQAAMLEEALYKLRIEQAQARQNEAAAKIAHEEARAAEERADNLRRAQDATRKANLRCATAKLALGNALGMLSVEKFAYAAPSWR